MAQVKRAKKKRSNPKRKLSPKQVKFFGTPQQKAALKAARKRKRTAAAPKKRKAAPRRNTAPRAAAPRKRTARRKPRANPVPAGYQKARAVKVIRNKRGQAIALKILK